MNMLSFNFCTRAIGTYLICYVRTAPKNPFCTDDFLLSFFFRPESDTEVARSLQEAINNNNMMPHHHAGRTREETAEQGVRIPAVLSGLAVFVGVMMVFWQRKRQFDRKGMHKKTESF